VAPTKGQGYNPKAAKPVRPGTAQKACRKPQWPGVIPGHPTQPRMRPGRNSPGCFLEVFPDLCSQVAQAWLPKPPGSNLAADTGFFKGCPASGFL
jgi:hypothetical protein